ncbi:MAG: leucyl aminopeptidase [Myxococcota bacterium]
MKLKVIAKDLRGLKSELAVMPVLQSPKFNVEEFLGAPRKLVERIKMLATKRKIEFESGETILIESPEGIDAGFLLLLGVGKTAECDNYTIRTFAARAIKESNELKASTLSFLSPSNTGEELLRRWIYHLAVGALLSTYRFDKYLSEEKRKKYFVPSEFRIISPLVKEADKLIARASVVAESVFIARDIVNEPGSGMFPEKLAEVARKVAMRIPDLSASVWDEKRILKERMNLLYEVGKGSTHKPRFIILEYKPRRKPTTKRKAVLVGKGLTFDTGGINLKPAQGGMLEMMKMDKGGGAAIIGAMAAIARLKPPFPVIGLVPAAENANDGGAYLPGDIIRGRKGITVEVNNTDAEGRLILADALAYACELKPTEIIDTATLTGACMVALGMFTTGLFTPDDEIAKVLEGAASRAAEHIWRLPLTEKVGEGLKTPSADTKNSGGRFGGAISAALFLKKFVDPTIKWAHLDIAGPAFTEKAYEFFSYGGTGVITETLVEFITPNDI